MRAVWQVTPAFDREQDAVRALKLSELAVNSVVYGNRAKNINEYVNVFESEMRFLVIGEFKHEVQRC